MKPGKVPGPIRIKPKKKGDLTDYRRAKRLQDYLNLELAKPEAERVPREVIENSMAPPWVINPRNSDR